MRRFLRKNLQAGQKNSARKSKKIVRRVEKDPLETNIRTNKSIAKLFNVKDSFLMYYSKNTHEIGLVSRRAAKNIGARECRKIPLVFIQPQFFPQMEKVLQYFWTKKSWAEKISNCRKIQNENLKNESVQSFL